MQEPVQSPRTPLPPDMLQESSEGWFSKLSCHFFQTVWFHRWKRMEDTEAVPVSPLALASPRLAVTLVQVSASFKKSFADETLTSRLTASS